ncbi:GNAT family N-acetyltransferase [Pseudobacteroides cellulosolvens]|uniref:GCN5-related N-acetyltransferase n=1 Tax=Pseudobacteroides cellulosolvens ATCC 35603 = DSM 2933 TaxID=398512 RepID=A0A0L6JJ58_9FIRM|nr:GNAT family protein [Pseudobacteroides cellulosolvens]KNY25911.1 GCN5-related N-acetyltransferase [Pseudobacteroides cellulosolvens ATCC 35603 = DSM 2933]
MVRLELLDKTDFGHIVKWFETNNEDFLVQWAGPTYQYPLTVQQMEEHYKNGFNGADSDTYLYKIIETDSNEFIGSIQLCKIDKVNLCAVVGRFIIGVEGMRGKGFGKSALNGLVRIGFEDFGLKKLHLKVFDRNENAIKCYQKVGFIIVKHMSDVYKANDGFWGEYDMSICCESWRESK